MLLNKLTAISPVDGRYRNQTEKLADYFSEYALIRYRIRVEVEYFIALCELPLPELSGVEKSKFEALRALYLDFSDADARRVKEIESVTNHDVKAIEYIIKEKMDTLGLEAYKEFVHFGLTSQDINNTSIPLTIKDALAEVYFPAAAEVLDRLREMAREWHDVPMLARTHGQPASPTRLGKEMLVFVERLEKQLAQLRTLPVPAKFGGATGNFNAHHVAYPAVDWVAFANGFVNDRLGLERSQYTTQIEHYDNLAAIFDNLKRIDTVLIDLCRDMWMYISMEYFKQRIKRMIITSGYNVYPSQLENILDAHDLVQMSCVIGVPDSLKMQKVKAFVMLKPGLKPCDEYRDILMAYCRKNIAKYAMPYEIEFREQLPKTLVGKVAYRVLEEEEINRLNGEKKNEA